MTHAQTDITVYGIKNCDTMKKTFTWFEQAGVAYTFVDYKKAGVVAAELSGWIAAVGWEPLLNRKGLTWKKLSDADRAEMDATKAASLMVAHPTLIKRPVVVCGQQVVVGLDVTALARLAGVAA